MTQPNVLELAKQGDAKAIATYLNYPLQSKGITAKATLKNACLQIMLEADKALNQEKSVVFIQKTLSSLQLESIKQVKVYGRQTNEDFPDWEQEFQLEKPVDLPASKAEGTVEAESLTPSINTEPSAMIHTPASLPVQVPQAEKPSLWGSVFGTVAGAAGAVGGAAVQAGGAVAGAAIGAAGAVGGVALQAGGAVAGAAIGAAGAAGIVAGQAINIAGQAIEIVGKNPQLQQAIKSLNKDWLIPLIDQVDIVKAETAVRQLQEAHPSEQSAQIAHRLMLEKAVYAGGTGLTTSLMPGQAAAMFAVDWVATAVLSAELVYQIAAAYGLDLQDPARKGEVVAIFGLGLGGKTAIKAGLGLLRNLPVAGAVIGASSNAVMIYALGYAACRFYEATQKPVILEATLEEARVESEKYLAAAISQEKIMDQILVHIVLATHSDKSWEDILPELQTANLSPESLEVISAHIKSPPPLETLLDQLNRDFAVSVLAQCLKISQMDEVITPEEAKVINTITHRFDIDLDAIKEQLTLQDIEAILS